MEKLATHITKTFDIADVRLLPYNFEVQLPHVLPFFVFVREAFGSVTTARNDALALDARFHAAHDFLQNATQQMLKAAHEDDLFTL